MCPHQDVREEHTPAVLRGRRCCGSGPASTPLAGPNALIEENKRLRNGLNTYVRILQKRSLSEADDRTMRNAAAAIEAQQV